MAGAYASDERCSKGHCAVDSCGTMPLVGSSVADMIVWQERALCSSAAPCRTSWMTLQNTWTHS